MQVRLSPPTSRSNVDSHIVIQWLALTPPDLVKAHLDVSDETIAHFSKEKQMVTPPQP